LACRVRRFRQWRQERKRPRMTRSGAGDPGSGQRHRGRGGECRAYYEHVEGLPAWKSAPRDHRWSLQDHSASRLQLPTILQLAPSLGTCEGRPARATADWQLATAICAYAPPHKSRSRSPRSWSPCCPRVWCRLHCLQPFAIRICQLAPAKTGPRISKTKLQLALPLASPLKK
jgi:hypothetical protein